MTTTTTNPKPSPIHIAVLDDWTSTAPPHFHALQDDPSLDIKISYLLDPIKTRDASQLSHAISYLQPFTIISSMRERTAFPASLLSQLPNLRLLLNSGSRNASIDLDAAEKAGIIVTGTKSIHGGSTNEQTWALILGVVKRVAEGDVSVKRGGWQVGTGLHLAGRTLGLLGLGRLGSACAVTGKLGFGMNVLAWSSSLTQEKADEIAVSKGLGKGGIKVAASKEELFREADVLSVHYVLSDRSRGIVAEKELGVMKRDAVLVNTSRGPLVDEVALVKALREKRIRGVGLDVFDAEPLPDDSVWRNEEWGGRVVLSPHMGYVEDSTMNYWYEQQVENIRRWIKGEQVVGVMDYRYGP